MKTVRLLITLCVIIALFFIGLLFVVSNAEQVTLSLLFSDLSVTFSLGGLLLLTLIIGVILGIVFAMLRQWLGSAPRHS